MVNYWAYFQFLLKSSYCFMVISNLLLSGYDLNTDPLRKQNAVHPGLSGKNYP